MLNSHHKRQFLQGANGLCADLHASWRFLAATRRPRGTWLPDCPAPGFLSRPTQEAIDDATTRAPRVRSALARGIGFFGLWLLLTAPLEVASLAALAPNLLVGVLAATWATAASLRLLSPVAGRLRVGALGRLIASFLWQSVVGGVDVALRAFHPRLPLRTGFLAWSTGLSAGTWRAAFGAITSLMPRTLPVGIDRGRALVYHCLDLDQPVAAGLDRAEALLAHTRAGGSRD